MSVFILKHKDADVALLDIDKDGNVDGYKSILQESTPYLGTADLRKIRTWWKTRGVPLTRHSLDVFLAKQGITSVEEYLIKNLALSMTDCYWICPYESELSWESVNLRSMLADGVSPIPIHNASSYDPNATLSGNMSKYWDLSNETPVLVKEAREYYGLQALNEEFATIVNYAQNINIPFVRYQAHQVDDGYDVRCQCFAAEDVEFIPALEVIESVKAKNNVSIYDQYIQTCANYGIEKDEMQQFMDYQTSLDFVISNTDEHLLNFGVLRDADTLRMIAPAPIYDNGNSMFYNENAVYTRTSILSREITSFHKNEEKMLGHIKNKMILKESLLPSPSEVRDFYSQAAMPEKKLDMIVKNYETKLALFHDFQNGVTISYYSESKRKNASVTKKGNDK